jgi:hypothetical protein
MAEMLEEAMEEEDVERIAFLIDHMPANDPDFSLDAFTVDTMRKLSDYVCHDLKDEALASKLVLLRYDMVRVDVAKTGFGRVFSKALMTDLDFAVHHVLRLQEWHAPLSEKDINFVLHLPDPLLRSIHKLHLLEAIEGTMKSGDDEAPVKLMRIRAEIMPFSLTEYDRLLGLSMEYKNREVYNFVLQNMPRIDVYSMGLIELAKTPVLFRMHAPKLLRNIEPTLGEVSRRKSISLGQVDELLRSSNPQAALFVVQKYDLQRIWSRVPTNGRTLLMAVCEGGNVEAAKYLIEEKGADIRDATEYYEVEVTVLGRARPKEGKLRAIHFAAIGGSSRMIRYLHSIGANVNERSVLGTTPLMMAASRENVEAAKTLIALGADVNAQMSDNLTGRDLADQGGIESLRTAYRRALQTGNPDMLELLKKNGARP